MPDPNLRPYVSLIIGVFLTGLGLASTCSGEALGRFGRTTSCVEEPKKFWRLVAIDYLGGAFGIGYFLFEKYIAKWTDLFHGDNRPAVFYTRRISVVGPATHKLESCISNDNARSSVCEVY